MHKNLKYKILGLILVLFSALFPIKTTLAQTGQGLTISPPLSELKLEPGNTYQQTIKVNNPTSELVTVYPVARNFTASGETGVPSIESPGQDASYGLASWISFSQTKLALTSQQEVEFKYTIKVPLDAEPGGHYASVLFASEPPKPDQNTTQVSLASMLGSLVLGTVSGEIVEKGEVAEFSSDGKIFLKSNIPITLRISNTGNVHFAPKGQIEITNWGKKVLSQDINSKKGNILPKTVRKFEDLGYQGKWYSFGKFNVQLKASYGGNNQSLTGNFSFWIIPWWLIVLLIIILALIIVLIRIYRQKAIKSKPIATPEPIQRKKIILQ